MAYDYPILLDLTDRAILIVGGGNVAARKAAGLIAAGAAVVAVAISFIDDFPKSVVRRTGPYKSDDLAGVDLVFAATDSGRVNDRVVADARAAGIWVCRADGSDTAAGDFVTPAIARHGPVTVTVSAGSAALAVSIRDHLSKRFDPRWAELAAALSILRPWVLAGGWTAERRKAALKLLASVEALTVLADSGVEGLKLWATEGTKLTI